jgi:hypothetical protein
LAAGFAACTARAGWPGGFTTSTFFVRSRWASRAFSRSRICWRSSSRASRSPESQSNRVFQSAEKRWRSAALTGTRMRAEEPKPFTAPVSIDTRKVSTPARDKTSPSWRKAVITRAPFT